MSKLEQLIQELCPDGVEFRTIEEVSNVFAGGDVPRDRFSKEKTEKFNIPIYSNGTGLNALYGWTDSARITVPCVTIAARGTIGYTELRQEPFFPIIRLICVIPKKRVSVNYLKHAIETIQFNVPLSGIPQLTIPMVSKYKIPLPPLPVQEEIVRILDKFTLLEAELEAELEARQKQYEYYRDGLLEFGDDVPMVSTWEVCSNILAGGDLPKKYKKGQKEPSKEFPYPIYSNGTENGALYGYTDEYKINETAVTISARGTIGYHMIREGKFTPIVRLITLIGDESKIGTKFLNYALYIAGIEGVTTGIPSLTLPMLKKFKIPLPPLEEQARIVAILDRFDALVNDISVGLPAEIEARRKQYEYYRDKLLTFKEKEV